MEQRQEITRTTDTDMNDTETELTRKSTRKQGILQNVDAVETSDREQMMSV